MPAQVPRHGAPELGRQGPNGPGHPPPMIYLLLLEFFLTTSCALQMCILDIRLPGVVVLYIYIYSGIHLMLWDGVLAQNYADGFEDD